MDQVVVACVTFMTTVIIALVSFAIAFAAGFTMSKAYFTVHGLGDAGASARKQLKEQRQHYRKRIEELQGTIRDHEDAQELMRKKLGETRQARNQLARARRESAGPTSSTEDMESQINIRDSEIAALRERIGPLNEALDTEKCKARNAEAELSLLRIERDELIALKQRIESEHAPATRADGADVDQTAVAARLREDLGAMRENLAARDRQVLDLELQVKDSRARVEELEDRLESWKHRVQPLTKKLKEQRNTIRHYRETQAAPEKTDRQEQSSDATDNLKKIRGIGPALERRLHRHGIHRYEQIAELSERELIEIAEQLAIAPNLAQRDRWIEQARDLALQGAVSA